ncbi:Cytochrome c oxidase polypeptide II [Paraburkholderia caribensis]|nr:Cytochrome c oxidase polypeptide II [Paraburkholderia caribensis]
MLEQGGHVNVATRQAALQSVRAPNTGEIELPGAGVYESFCACCHQADGTGQRKWAA